MIDYQNTIEEDLPEFHHEHDEKWLKSIFNELPRKTHNALRKEYSILFHEAVNNQSFPEAKRKNIARVNANNWLRSKVERYREIMKIKDELDNRRNSI